MLQEATHARRTINIAIRETNHNIKDKEKKK